MRKIIVSLIATAAIIASMSHGAAAATRYKRLAAPAGDTVRNARGSVPRQDDPADIVWGSRAHSGMGAEDPRTAGNGN